jgi:hypothetical protein
LATLQLCIFSTYTMLRDVMISVIDGYSIRFLSKKLGYVPERDPNLPYVRPAFADVARDEDALDVQLAASGFQKQHQKDLEAFLQADRAGRHLRIERVLCMMCADG